MDAWETVSERRRGVSAGEATRDELYAEARLLGIRGRGRMTKGELASAIGAAAFPSPAHVFPFRRVRLCLAAVLREGRRSEGLILPVVVAAFAAALGGAMPLLVYDMGPQPVEGMEPLAPTHNSAGSSVAPIVALNSSSGERSQSDEQGRADRNGSPRGARSQTPAVASPAKNITSSFDEEGERSHRQPASAQTSGGGASEPTTAPSAAFGQDDEASAPVPEEEAEGSTGADAKVTLCHKAGAKKEGVTITVSEDAVPEHLAHGDIVGACAEK